MESNSKEANMKFPSFDFNDIQLYDGNNIMVHNETAAVNFSKHPTITEASIMPITPTDVDGALTPSPLTTNDQPQVDQANANPNTFAQDMSSNPNLVQPIYSGFEGNGSSLGHDDAHQPASPAFSPLIMEPTNSFPMALAERLPQDGGLSAPPFYSGQHVNSVQANQINGNIGSSRQAEFQQNNGNSNYNVNQQAHPYPNMFPQTSNGTEYLHGGGSTQINQHTPNNLYRPLAQSGSQQVNQFRAIGNSDPSRSSNIMPSRSFAPIRPQESNNAVQLLNQVPNMPNASNSLLQNPMLNNHSRPQDFSYQHDQVPMAPEAYNQQTFGTRLPQSSMPTFGTRLPESSLPTFGTRLPESSMPLRTPMLPLGPQTNPFDVSDLGYRNSFQPRAPMHPSGGFMLQDENDQRRHQFNQFSPMTNQFGTQSGNSMLQESLMNSGDQQQQGLFNQTTKPIANFPTSRRSQASMVFNSLIQNESGNTSSAAQPGNSRRPREPAARSILGLGESSSSFKRFRREESNLPQASNGGQENMSLFSQRNEANTSTSNTSTRGLAHPRRFENSLYDPLFEKIGLPIDPHLRLFATL